MDGTPPLTTSSNSWRPSKAPNASTNSTPQSTSLLNPSGSTYRLHNRGSTNAAVLAASPFYHREQNAEGLLPREKLAALFSELNLTSQDSTSSDTAEVVNVVAGDATTLTFDQT